MTRIGWLLLALGLVLRLCSCTAHQWPRGDVVLDVGVARSLVSGQGFASGYERGVVALPEGALLPPQGHADQHPPLWPLLGALFTPLAGSPFGGLKLAAFLASLVLLALVWRMTDRLLESCPGAPDGVAPLAAGLVAVGSLMVDAAGSGALYGVQAALVLALVESLSGPRPRVLLPGLLLGALYALNHQALVLLPLPLLMALPGLRRAGGRVAVRASLGVVALALLCQLPWWLRNAAVFGDALHSVNGHYLHYWSGAAVRFALEDGQPVQRVASLPLGQLLFALPGFASRNALYLLLAGTVCLPGVLGPALAALPDSLRRGLLGDRRRLGLVLAALALGAVALLWPASKLRYLVSLAPIVVMLGLDALVRLPGSWDRWAGRALLLLWLLALTAAVADAFGDPASARPLRALWLGAGGALVLVLPLLLRGRARQSGGWLFVLSGAPLLLALTLAVTWGPGSGTAYHGHAWLPDAFGQDAEARDVQRDLLLVQAVEAARVHDLQRLAGPVALLAHTDRAPLELPPLAGEPLVASLQALLDADRFDAVVLLQEPGDPTDLGPAAARLIERWRSSSSDGQSARLLEARKP